MNRIKELRKKFDETQEDLAKAVGSNKSTISKYENELRILPPNVLLKIADHYCVSTDYILGRITEENEDLESIKSLSLIKKLGIENQKLSAESINKIAEYINFIKQQEKNKK